MLKIPNLKRILGLETARMQPPPFEIGALVKSLTGNFQTANYGVVISAEEANEMGFETPDKDAGMLIRGVPMFYLRTLVNAGYRAGTAFTAMSFQYVQIEDIPTEIDSITSSSEFKRTQLQRRKIALVGALQTYSKKLYDV